MKLSVLSVPQINFQPSPLNWGERDRYLSLFCMATNRSRFVMKMLTDDLCFSESGFWSLWCWVVTAIPLHHLPTVPSWAWPFLLISCRLSVINTFCFGQLQWVLSIIAVGPWRGDELYWMQYNTLLQYCSGVQVHLYTTFTYKLRYSLPLTLALRGSKSPFI